MLKVRGVMVYPSQIEDVIASVPGTAKEAWQIYVESKDAEGSLNDIEVAIERLPAADCEGTDLALRVKALLKARLGLTCKVVCFAEGSLPRYEAKATRVLHR